MTASHKPPLERLSGHLFGPFVAAAGHAWLLVMFCYFSLRLWALSSIAFSIFDPRATSFVARLEVWRIYKKKPKKALDLLQFLC